jgi:hypothetical protein
MAIPLGNPALRRFAAAALAVALLYFAGGGSFLHLHQGGHETVCHVCQSLHAPVLGVASSLPVSNLEIAGWHDPLRQRHPDSNGFSPACAERAPPTL